MGVSGSKRSRHRGKKIKKKKLAKRTNCSHEMRSLDFDVALRPFHALPRPAASNGRYSDRLPTDRAIPMTHPRARGCGTFPSTMPSQRASRRCERGKRERHVFWRPARHPWDLARPPLRWTRISTRENTKARRPSLFPVLFGTDTDRRLSFLRLPIPFSLPVHLFSPFSRQRTYFYSCSLSPTADQAVGLSAPRALGLSLSHSFSKFRTALPLFFKWTNPNRSAPI